MLARRRGEMQRRPNERSDEQTVRREEANVSRTVTNIGQLKKALVEHKGETITLLAGKYFVGEPLVVPEKTTLKGQLSTSEEWNTWFDRWDGRPRRLSELIATPNLDGDMITLSNRAEIRNLYVEDCERGWKDAAHTTRKSGNLVNIRSTDANQSIAASVTDCDLFNPNPPFPPTNDDQLISRGINVTTWNGHENSIITVKVSGCRIVSAANSPGLCAVNFSFSSYIHVMLTESHIVGGGIDFAAGVSRPYLVSGSEMIIQSDSNIFVGAEGPNLDAGWRLYGSINPPNSAFHAIDGTTSNKLIFSSTNDIISGFRLGIDAFAGYRPHEKSEDGSSLGLVSDNRTNLTMNGTKLYSSERDFRFTAARNGGGEVKPDGTIAEQFIPGNNNILHVCMNGVVGSGNGSNIFKDSSAGSGEINQNVVGSGNRLLFQGKYSDFVTNNGGIKDIPPAEFFE